ncbi:Pex19 protein [Kalaharituber pfeilii]|nr:Pex19 protein [Kalaharituber pfeilii]
MSASTSSSSPAGGASQTNGSSQPPPPTVRHPTVEDEDENEDESEDDDLDALLDEFNKAANPTPRASTTGSNGGGPGMPSNDGGSEEDVTKQLQMGMADLLGELGSSVTAAAAASNPVPVPPSFSDTINRAMSRLHTSTETITSDIADSADTDDFLAEMLQQMGPMSGLSGDSEEDFSKMLLNMMEQLTNKEILYEPMRELADKYPEWLERNETKLPKEQLDRYREQYEHVKDICRKFEEPTYMDSSTTDREYILEKMQKMQAAGSPPAELMGGMSDIPPEVESACPLQ